MSKVEDIRANLNMVMARLESDPQTWEQWNIITKTLGRCFRQAEKIKKKYESEQECNEP